MKGDKGKDNHSTNALPGSLMPRGTHNMHILTCFATLEFTGTLNGFDDYVNMVLEDVTEL